MHILTLVLQKEVCIYLCMNECMMCVYIYACMCMYVCMCVSMYLCMCVCIYVCVYVCMYVYIVCMYVHIVCSGLLCIYGMYMYIFSFVLFFGPDKTGVKPSDSFSQFLGFYRGFPISFF